MTKIPILLLLSASFCFPQTRIKTSQIDAGSKTGTGPTLVTATGSLSNGCAQLSGGNLISTGTACTSVIIDVTAAPYNAVCGDIGNQATAINAAVTAVNIAGGGSVTAPGGCILRVSAFSVLLKSNVMLAATAGAWTIHQATANLEAVSVVSGASNFGIDGVTITGGGLFITNGPVSDMKFLNGTISGITNTTYPFNQAISASFPMTSTTISNFNVTNVTGGFDMLTQHGLKISQGTFTNVGNGTIQSDAIYLHNTGTGPSDTNCSNSVQITNISMTGLTRMGVETQNCFVDPAVITNVNISRWAATAGLALSYGISINNLNTLAASAGAIITNPVITGAGSTATFPQMGIEMASPGVAIRGGTVQNLPRGTQATTGSGANGGATIQGVTFSGNGAAVDTSADGSGISLIGNTFKENNTDIFFEDGTACNAYVDGNTFTRTPAIADGSGDKFQVLLGNASSGCPRTFKNLTFRWPTGTIPGGAAYKAFNNSASVPGTIMDNITMQNDDSAHSASWGGVFCSSGALFNGQAFINSKLVNISDPFNCTSSTVSYGNNKAMGNTPATAQIFIGQNLSTTTFALLGTTALNGTLIYCSDCTGANPVAGSGTGVVARRENGAWNGGGASGGSGTVTVVAAGNLTSTAIVTGGGSQTAQTPSSLATVDSSGNIAGTSITTGSAPPSVTAGTGGVWFCNEGTGPSAGPATGVDGLVCDSTQHGIMANFNNGGYLPLVQGPATNTSGNLAKFSGTNGGKLVDGGANAHAIAFAIGDPGGSAITAGSTATAYVTVPFACTITAWNLLVDAGTVTVKFWKIATGTAIPTVTQSINTSGVAISSGTAIHSATLTDFTSTSVALNDIVAMNVSTVATAKYVQGVLQCNQ